MKTAYLDNASTTAIRPEVIKEMTTVMETVYGNPSSTHGTGRAARGIVETSRKSIASLLKAEAREIIFTSGATEAINWVINSVVADLKIERIITSRIEHHAVLHTIDAVKAAYGTKVDYIELLHTGDVDLSNLVKLLSEGKPTLVCLMHVNNEIGTVLDVDALGNICSQHNALFFSDTVQSIGKHEFDLQNLPVDFLVASAHKFHGPKGAGFAYVRKNIQLRPILHGGEQEKGLRAGTEAVHQIAGMAKALQLSYALLAEEKIYVTSLRMYLIEQLNKHFPDFAINGNERGNGFYNLLNFMLPLDESKTAMILFHLDMKGIAVSRGSACQSGSIKPSHVLQEILSPDDVKKPSLRVSLSHYNTKEDIDMLIEALKAI